MSWRNLFHLVRRNLLRMRMRVAMTAMGVVIGTASIVLLISLGAGLQKSSEESMASFGEITEITVYAPSQFTVFGVSPGESQMAILDNKELQEIKELPGVVAATPIISMYGGEIRFNRLTGHANIKGIDHREVDNLQFKMASGTARLGQWQAIVGARFANAFADPKGGRVNEAPDLQGQTLMLVMTRIGEDGQPLTRQIRIRVTGVLASTGGEKDYSLYLSIKDVDEALTFISGRRPNYDRDGYSQALVKVSEARYAIPVEQAIIQKGFFAYSMQTMIQQNNLMFMIIQAVLAGLGGVALLVAGFGIANAMVMAIYERTREIGLMKAVGARNREVLLVFLAEAGSIGLIGGIGGLFFGWAGGGLLNYVGKAYIASMVLQQGGGGADIPSIVYTPIWLAVFALAFSALVGVASGIYPALRATRLDPIKALRYE